MSLLSLCLNAVIEGDVFVSSGIINFNHYVGQDY